MAIIKTKNVVKISLMNFFASILDCCNFFEKYGIKIETDTSDAPSVKSKSGTRKAA